MNKIVRFNNLNKATLFCNKVKGKFIDCSNNSNAKSKYKVVYFKLTYEQKLNLFATGQVERIKTK